MKRRTLLKATGAAVALSPLGLLFTRRSSAGEGLVADPNGILDLRPGLTYRIVGRNFDRLSDGHRSPARPDGMACFAGADGRWVLMRNHELEDDADEGAFDGHPPRDAFDPRAQGGVTRLVLDPESLEVDSSNVVLAGTLRNCAGGPSPWGWLSCEETTEPGHGYVFACPSDASKMVKPRPIRGYGRFRHEAVAIDPETHVAYLTEDQGDGCLYRFVPRSPKAPFVGRLQAMRRADVANYSTSARMGQDRTIAVDWVDVPEPDPAGDTVRTQAHERGAARVSRGEGIWYHGGAIYFSATNGGQAESGQVFRLVLGRGTMRDRLELVVESPGSHVLDYPDNITVAPGGTVFVAEDGGGDQLIRAITSDGRVHDVARNARSTGELAGVCFSPDASTLFFNMQHDGLTVAVTGSWDGLS